MSNYRQLTQSEIDILENNVCWAEDWQRVMVAEGFKPYNFHRVMFYGDIRLGEFNKRVEVAKGFQIRDYRICVTSNRYANGQIKE